MYIATKSRCHVVSWKVTPDLKEIPCISIHYTMFFPKMVELYQSHSQAAVRMICRMVICNSVHLFVNRVYIGKRLTTPPASSFWTWNWRKVPEKWPWVVGESFAVVRRTPVSPSPVPPATPPPHSWDMTCSQEKCICLFLPSSPPFFIAVLQLSVDTPSPFPPNILHSFV